MTEKCPACFSSKYIRKDENLICINCGTYFADHEFRRNLIKDYIKNSIAHTMLTIYFGESMSDKITPTEYDLLKSILYIKLIMYRLTNKVNSYGDGGVGIPYKTGFYPNECSNGILNYLAEIFYVIQDSSSNLSKYYMENSYYIDGYISCLGPGSFQENVIQSAKKSPQEMTKAELRDYIKFSIVPNFYAGIKFQSYDPGIPSFPYEDVDSYKNAVDFVSRAYTGNLFIMEKIIVDELFKYLVDHVKSNMERPYDERVSLQYIYTVVDHSDLESEIKKDAFNEIRNVISNIEYEMQTGYRLLNFIYKHNLGYFKEYLKRN